MFKNVLIIVVFFLGHVVSPIYAVAQDKVVRVAVRAHSGVEAAYDRWNATAEYLTRSIPGNRFVLVPFTHNSLLMQEVSQGKFDFVLTNPSAFVELKMRYGLTSLATLVNKRAGEGYMQFGSVIFTRADRSDINNYQDLKNKIFMAVDELGFGGWRVAWQELLRNKIDPFKHFKEIRFAGGVQHDVVYAVRDGKADVGTVRTDMLEGMADKGLIKLEDFKVLGIKQRRDFPFLLSTQLFPEWSFSKTRATSNSLGIQVRQALLALQSDAPAAIDGHYVGWIKSLDYGPVQELMMELRVGPFHMTSHDLMPTTWEDYRYLLLLVVLIVLLAVIFLLLKVKVVKPSR